MVKETFYFARMPTLHFGAGMLAGLPRATAAFGGEALVVTGAFSLQASGQLAKIHDSLHKAGIRFHSLIIDAEPSTRFIDEACARLRSLNLNVVIGIGGGSVIDGAKAISAMLPHGNSVLDHLEDVGSDVPHSGIKIPYIAIPTTSGTGGEMTKNAVLSMVGTHGYKKSLRHENLIPDTVIIDPELMLSCPAHITAACGMDAFTQLLEPYLSPIASTLTDTLALSGLEKIRDCLIPSCTYGSSDISVRAGMAYASMVSGVVLANAGLGIVHGLASPIGGFFPVPHGVVCGTLVASATEINIAGLRRRGDSTSALAKYAKVGLILGGGEGKSQSYLCDFLVDTLRDWTETLKLPRLSDYGIGTQDFDRIADKTSNRHNPVPLDKNEICEILSRRL